MPDINQLQQKLKDLTNQIQASQQQIAKFQQLLQNLGTGATSSEFIGKITRQLSEQRSQVSMLREEYKRLSQTMAQMTGRQRATSPQLPAGGAGNVPLLPSRVPTPPRPDVIEAGPGHIKNLRDLAKAASENARKYEELSGEAKAYGSSVKELNVLLDEQRQRISRLRERYEKLYTTQERVATSRDAMRSSLIAGSGRTGIRSRIYDARRSRGASPEEGLRAYKQAVRSVKTELPQLGVSVDNNRKVFIEEEKILERLAEKFGSIRAKIYSTRDAYQQLNTQTKKLKDAPQADPFAAANEKAKRAQKRKEEDFSEKQLKNIEKLYPRVAQKAAEYGFEMDKLRKVSTEASNGQQRFNFTMTDSNNIVKNLSLTTNKFGEVLVDTQRRFKGFGAAVGRNIQEVFKWAIAAQLVWLPMRKLQDITGEMIELQTKLAAATIATGQSFEMIGPIFESASEVAKDTGSSVLGVVEGYELAYRAAGRYGDGAERSAKATSLLQSAMTLASISGLDEAKAIDTLAGALIQTNRELDQGIELLDSWVAVSKNAAVSIETLAESFAITASSAENAGIDVNRLNGYVAVLAENTTLSASEVGNAMRAFVTGYQTDNARTELQNLGIAVENTKGEALEFDFVLQQIFDRVEAGTISPAQLNKLATAIGGGNRRATQFITLLENLDRAQQVAETSTSAHGDAEEALAVQMQTVTKSLQNLETSFKQLAQTLGTEGGVLDGINAAAKTLSWILEVTSKLVEVMGSSIPVIGAFGLAFAKSIGGALGRDGDLGVLDRRVGTIGQFFANRLPPTRERAFASPYSIRQDTFRQPRNPSLAAGFTQYGAAGLATTLQVGGSLAAGQFGRAGGQAIGGGVGAYLGSALGFLGGGPAGALVGSQLGAAIVGSMTSAIWDYESEWTDFFEGTLKESMEGASDTQRSLLDMSANELRELRDEIANETGRGFLKDIATTGLSIGGQIGEFAGLWGDSAGREEIAFDIFVSDEDKETIEDISNLIESKTTPAEEVTLSAAIKLEQEYEGVIEGQQSELENRLREEVISGDVTSKRFRNLSDRIEGFGGVATNVVTLVEDQMQELNPEIETTTELFDYLFDFLYYASEDQVKQISAMVGEMIDFKNATNATAEDLENYQRLLQDLPRYITASNVENRADRVQIPSIVDMTDIGRGSFDTIIDYAEERMSTIWEELPEDFKEGLEKQDWKNSVDPFLVELGDGTFRVLRGVTQEALKAGFEAAEKEGLVSKIADVGIADYRDFTKEQFTQQTARVPAIASRLEKLGYEPQFEEQIVLFKDGFAKMTLEQTITNLILKDILDTQEEQLEGIYNLPADMSFYVPFSGYSLGQGGGGGGLGGLEALFEKYFGDLTTGATAPQETPEVSNELNRLRELQESRLEEKLDATFRVRGRTEPDALRPDLLPGQQPGYATTYTPEVLPDYSGFELGVGTGIGEIFKQLFREPINQLFQKLISQSIEEEETPYKMSSPTQEGKFGSLQDLIRYFTSGQFYNDAMGVGGGGATPEQASDVVIEMLRGLESIDLYDDIDRLGEWLQRLFQTETAEEGGPTKLAAPPPLEGNTPLDRLIEYFTSGKFYNDAMQGAPTTQESFSGVLSFLEGLGLGAFGYKATDEMKQGDPSFLDQLRELFQKTVIPNVNLEIQSNTVLTLDGQTVATSVKSYLAEDLLSQELASGDVTRQVVI